MNDIVYHVRVIVGTGVDVGIDNYYVAVKLENIKTNIYETKFLRAISSIPYEEFKGSTLNSEYFKNELKYHSKFYDSFDASKQSAIEYIERTMKGIYGDDAIISCEERHDADSTD